MSEEKQGNNTMKWLLGCSGGLVLLAILCGGAAYLGFGMAKEKLIELAHQGVSELIEDTGLPEEQVDSMLADLDRLRTAAEDGDLDLARLENVEAEVEAVLMLGIVQWYGANVVAEVGFPPEEEAAAQRTLQRLARGLQDGTLDGHDVDLKIERDENVGEHGWDPKEVRRTIARIDDRVEAAGIPDEPFQADVAQEFTRLIDSLLE